MTAAREDGFGPGRSGRRSAVSAKRVARSVRTPRRSGSPLRRRTVRADRHPRPPPHPYRAPLTVRVRRRGSATSAHIGIVPVPRRPPARTAEPCPRARYFRGPDEARSWQDPASIEAPRATAVVYRSGGDRRLRIVEQSPGPYACPDARLAVQARIGQASFTIRRRLRVVPARMGRAYVRECRNLRSASPLRHDQGRAG